MLHNDAVLSTQHEVRPDGGQRLLSFSTFLTLLRAGIRLPSGHDRAFEVCIVAEGESRQCVSAHMTRIVEGALFLK